MTPREYQELLRREQMKLDEYDLSTKGVKTFQAYFLDFDLGDPLDDEDLALLEDDSALDDLDPDPDESVPEDWEDGDWVDEPESEFPWGKAALAAGVAVGAYLIVKGRKK